MALIKKFFYYCCNTKIINFFLVAGLLVIFNLVVFDLETLLLDDQVNYITGLNQNWPWDVPLYKPFNLNSLFRHSFAELTVISPKISRVVMLLFVILPTSLCFYYLYRKLFKLPEMVAITASVLPTILPGQWQIPAFITNVPYGLLFAIVSFIYGLHYLRSCKKNKELFFLGISVFCFLITNHLMDDAIFLIAPFTLGILGYTKFNRKHFLLISSFLAITLAKLSWTLLNPRPANQAASLSGEKILSRFFSFFEFTSPIDFFFNGVGIESQTLSVSTIIGVVIVGFIVGLAKTDIRVCENNFELNHLPVRWQNIYLYTKFCAWSVFCSLPFIFLSPFFSSRYFYIASFGLNLLFIMSLYIILVAITKNNKLIISLSLLIVVVASGGNRHVELQKIFNIYNKSHNLLSKNLKKFIFPKNAQIVILGRTAQGTGGFWKWSSGYLKYTTGRDDITGILPYEYDYYNPFNSEERSHKYKMKGLDITKPIFIFRIDRKKGKLDQEEYALKWDTTTVIGADFRLISVDEYTQKKDDNSRAANWIIYKFDKTKGSAEKFREGKGIIDYFEVQNELQEQGIRKEDIVWGGIPSEDSKKRLEIGKY
jgi:hypothetical protein